MAKRLLIGLALLISACSNSQKDDQILRIALNQQIKTLDPANAYDVASLSVLPYVYESLYAYSYFARPFRIDPLLADGLPKLSADGKIATIRIKKGVFFQDSDIFPGGRGRELEAADFIFAWKRLLIPRLQSPGLWIFNDHIEGFAELNKAIQTGKISEDELLQNNFRGFTAIDRYTIQLRLLHSFPQLPAVLTTAFSAPVPHELVKNVKQEGLASRMVGTGAFYLKGDLPPGTVLLQKNPRYREYLYPSEMDDEARSLGFAEDSGKRLPLVDGIEFQIQKEVQSSWLQFLQQKIDIATVPKDSQGKVFTSLNQLSDELKEKGIYARAIEEPTIIFLAFNMQDPLVGKNLRLRQAITAAIDQQKIIDLFLAGKGVRPKSIIHPAARMGADLPRNYPVYDPEKAKLLAAEFKREYKLKNGHDLPSLRFDLRYPDTTTRQFGDFIKNSLEGIGIKVDVIANTLPNYLQKERNGNLQFFQNAWSPDYLDPENCFQLFYGKNIAPGPNVANWQDAAFDHLFKKISLLPLQSPERKILVKQAEERILDAYIWIPLYHPIRYELAQPWVKNFRNHPIYMNNWLFVNKRRDR